MKTITFDFSKPELRNCKRFKDAWATAVDDRYSSIEVQGLKFDELKILNVPLTDLAEIYRQVENARGCYAVIVPVILTGHCGH